MERRIGYFAFAGSAIGAALGLLIAAPSGRALAGLGIGALVGVFLGWFIAAAVGQLDRDRSKDSTAR